MTSTMLLPTLPLYAGTWPPTANPGCAALLAEHEASEQVIGFEFV